MTPRDGFPRLLARSVRRGDAQASQGVRDPVLSFGQKSRETAVPVVSADPPESCRRASKSLADAGASPAPSLLPGGLRRRSLGVIIYAPRY